jgi:hypothetical protein
MKARLKGMDSYTLPGLGELDAYTPEDPQSFALNLNITVGDRDAPWGELFTMTVCTPTWLARQMRSGALPGILPGRHYLFVKEYDIDQIERFIRQHIDEADFETWHEVATYVGRLAEWEFEDYDEATKTWRKLGKRAPLVS